MVPWKHHLSPEHAQCMAQAMKKLPPDLQLVANDGVKVAGYRSLLCLFSPSFSQILANHDQTETVISVYVPVTSGVLKAFKRTYENLGSATEKDQAQAVELLNLFSGDIKQTFSNILPQEDCLSDGEDQDSNMEDLEHSKVSSNDIKEDSVKQERDDEDDDPSYTVNLYKLDKSPKKERLERVKCKRCPKTFAYIAALNKHKQKHKEEDEDGDRESDDDDEGVVANTSTDEESVQMFRCEEGCSKSAVRNGRYTARFKLEGSLIRHYLKVHSKSHLCCGETFIDYKVYRKHLFKKHHNYQCAECAETFYRKEQLERHTKWQHDVEPQKCPVCPSVIKDVEAHLKNCHTGELMTCSACPYSSRRKADIDQHFKKVHTDLNKETCPVCGEMFKGLKLHLERTKCGTGKKAEATIPCPEGCPKMFTLQSTVDKHIRQVHLQIKNKICPFCEYKTYSRFNLNLHVTKMHEGKKMEKQQCLYCDKTPFALDYHMQTYHHDKI